MLRNRIPNRWWLWAALVIGLASVSIVTAASAHGSDTSLIHACVNARTGRLRIVGPTVGHIPGKHEVCGGNEVNLEWSITGPQGPKGDQGPQGPPGDLLLAGQSCPLSQFVTGVDNSGQLICAALTTPSPTDIPLPTAVSTPAPTSTIDMCSLPHLESPIANNKQLSVAINNFTGGDIILTNVQIFWPMTNGALARIVLDSRLIWNGNAEPPVSIEVSETISSGSSTLEFVFRDIAQTNGYEIALTFSGGCTVFVTN